MVPTVDGVIQSLDFLAKDDTEGEGKPKQRGQWMTATSTPRDNITTSIPLAKNYKNEDAAKITEALNAEDDDKRDQPEGEGTKSVPPFGDTGSAGDRDFSTTGQHRYFQPTTTFQKSQSL